jgi:hypothetical protein
MTFTEAAVEVLRREGKPLHFRKIAEIAIREDLLDHVGKIPEETMAGQLSAHCRLPHPERKMLAVQHGTFALVEWGLDEDPAGLDGIVEEPPEAEPPYRSRERHPIPSRELARAGRGEAGRGRRREGEERRGKRYPPPAEVAYEILAGAGRPLALVEIAAQGAERLLMPDAFVRDAASLGAALREDNRRREGAGRQPLFALEGDLVSLAAQPEPGERPAVPVVRGPATPAELRRAGLAALRRRLRECDTATIEHVAARLLERSGFRDLKVAKRGREHVIYTARRRMGLADVRHCVRILRGAADAGRRDVTEARRDLGHYGAQIGILLTPGEAGREARGEAAAAGQLPILLWCGEALSEALAEAGVGAVTVAVPEVDEGFFRVAAEAAALDEAARRARREERDREDRGGRERRRRPEPAPEEEGGPPAPVGPGAAVEAAGGEAAGGEEGPEDLEGEEPEGEAEGEEAEAGAGAAAEGARGEVRRRRRRRRRRGGRGRREGAGAAPAEAGAPPGEEGSAGGGAPPPEGPPAAAERPPEGTERTGSTGAE